jgi:hypothetical protein
MCCYFGCGKAASPKHTLDCQANTGHATLSMRIRGSVREVHFHPWQQHRQVFNP